MKPGPGTKQRLLAAAVDLIWQNSYASISVDDICSRAAVNKGSFYYAFKTKSELAVAAFDAFWNAKRPLLDEIFSSQNDPLQRLDKYCDLVVKGQLDKYADTGRMLGCPFCAVGCELSTRDDQIRGKAQEISNAGIRYLAGALRDLAGEGNLPPGTRPDDLARAIFCYMTGVLMQARIENSPAAVKEIKPGVYRLLGLSVPAVAG
ncbi:MAG TPA: helix-turn-helix domain-containing protein [Chthoniobacterales bacterium]